jgi:hypothetical protein
MEYTRMKISIRQLVGIAIPVVLLTVFFAQYDTVTTRTDSSGYYEFAKEMMSGEVLEKKEPIEMKYWRVVRTPGYPALILLATGGLKADINNLLSLHLAFAIASVVLVSLAMAPYCPPMLAGLMVVASLVPIRGLFSIQLTEWVGINIVFFMFAMIVVCIRHPSLRNLVITALIASIGVLIRPALAPLLLVAPCLVLYRRRLRFTEGLALSATLVPLLLWMSINWYAMDSFTLAQLRGQNLLGIGSMLGHAEVAQDDSPELAAFIEDFNIKKTPSKGAEQAFMDDLDTNFHRLQFESNIAWVAYPMKLEAGIGIVQFDKNYMEVYGLRAIRSNLGNYVRYVLHGLKIYFKYGIPYIAIGLLLIPLYGLYKQKALIASWAALAMFGIHLGHGLLVAGYQAVFERFIVLTFYPYSAAIAICFICLLLAEGLPQRVQRLIPGPLRAVLSPEKEPDEQR